LSVYSIARANCATGVLIVLTLVLASTPPVRGDDAERTVLVLGDSLSSAYGMATEQGWVALLEQKIQEQAETESEITKTAWSVINASVPGDTATSGAGRVQALLERHQPAVVIVELGGNDGLRGTPVDTISQALSTIIDKVSAAGAQTLLLGMRMPPNFGPRYVAEFHAVYRTLATDRGLAYVPFLLQGVATIPGMMQPDGVHPTAAAQPTMLGTVWAVLGPMLQ